MIGCYLRCSTFGKNEESQRAVITRWLRTHERSDVRWYVDDGDRLDRPAFDQLQADVLTGKIKTVVVSRMDEFAVEPSDSYKVLSDWVNRGIRVVVPAHSLDFVGEAGMTMARALMSGIEERRKSRCEAQAAGIAVAKQKGKYCGRKPGSFKANPHYARYLRSHGLTDSEIASAMNVTRRTVQRYLNG